MSVIEANINISIPDGVDPSQIIAAIQQTISKMNGRDTHVSVIRVDDPVSLSPVQSIKWNIEGN